MQSFAGLQIREIIIYCCRIELILTLKSILRAERKLFAECQNGH